MIENLRYSAFLFAVAVSAPCWAQDMKPVPARAWEHESSDIPVNPRIHFGALNNGMRFAWMTNGEPKNRCYVRIHVDAGSFAEEDSERGMAHFLEHICFNGSKNFAPGTLVEWFQKHGMAFGADTNAFTSFGQTVYQLDLPNSDESTLGEGLTVFRDFADGLLIQEKEVQAEKGVIDAEERERDSPGYRALVKSIEVQFAGTRIPDRMPIGTKSARDKFASASIRKFYEKWYRPENMTLVIVGDLKDLNPEKLIHDRFDSYRAPAAAHAPEPALGKPTYATKEFYIYDKDLPSVNLSIQLIRPWQERAENVKNAQADVPLDMARQMLNIRFSELAKKKDAAFANAGVSDVRSMSENIGFKIEEGEALNISCEASKWEKALEKAEYEVRRAIEFGFDDSEIEEVKADLLRSLSEGIEREKTKASGAFLQEILNAAENRSVPMTAATLQNILKPAIEKATVKDCHEAFKKAWSEGILIVSGVGNADLGPDGGKKIRSVYEESIKKQVKARKKVVKQKFEYASDPSKKGEVVAAKKNDEFDFTDVMFANGVRLLVKKTDFKEKQILLAAHVGEGVLSTDPGQMELIMMTGPAFSGGGLGKHSADDLRKLTAGKEVGAGLAASDESFVVSGATTKEDLVLQCDLMAAYFTDPGWRDDGLQQMLKVIPMAFMQMKHSVDAAIGIEFMRELYNRDARHVVPSQEKAEAITMDAIRGFVGPQLADAPLTLTIVGDLDVDATIQAVAQTFGNLPKRRAYDRHEDRRKPAELAVGKKYQFDVDSEETKTAVLIAYPATDGRDTPTRRRLNWLAAVLSDRLRIEVREKLGASYSPGSGATLSRVYPGDGFIAIRANADPDKVDALVDACIAAADSLAAKGVTEEELGRVREPQLASMRDALRTNGFWMQNLSGLHTNPNVLDDLRTMVSFAKEIKAEDLNPLAAKYLKRDRATVGIASPKKKAVEAPDGPQPPKKN
jgi:zinc protease